MNKNPIENKYSLFNINIFSTPIDSYLLESYNLQILEDEYNEKIKELNAKIEQFMKIKIEHKNKINNEINNLIKMFIEEYININKRDFDAPTNEDISLPFALQLSELLFREIREMVTYLVSFGSEIEYVFSGTYSSYIEFVKSRTGSGAHTTYSTLAKNLYDSINSNKKLENLNYINKDLSINEEKVFKNASINDLFESLTKVITD